MIFQKNADYDHFYTSEVTTQPTHTEEGVETFTCTCGDSYNNNYVSEKGHNYNGQMYTSCDKKV